LPRSKSIDLPALSTDGRWLSFSIARTVPNGIHRGFPGLMDLTTGELFDPAVDVGDFTSFDSVITGDGRGLVISTQADLDLRLGNADHNMELFYYDRVTGSFTQISETTGGIGSRPGGCPPYRPQVNSDGSMIVVGGLLRFDEEFCHLDGPQRNEADGFWFRFFRAVRKRPGNRGPVFERPEDVRVVAGDTLTMTFAAEDPDGDLISFFAQLKDGFDVPPGSVITDHYDGTATFRWPTRLEDAGTHVLRVAAFDEGGGEVFHDVTISVVPGRGTPLETATPTDTRTPRGTDTPTAPASTEIPNTVTPAPPTPSAPATTSVPATPTIDATPSAGATPSVSATPAVTCPGDCNGDGEVSIDELITGVGITINSELLSTCPALACGSANSATVDCLLRAIDAALNGCPR
jgi:hypothetical protein